jgi:type IV pilus assembly protein PilN
VHIKLNLATRPFADLGPALQRLRLGMGALGLIAIALGVALHFMHSQANAVRASESVLDTSISRVNQEREGYMNMVRQPDNAQELDQVASLNKLIDVKAFSWTLAMEDLETVLPGGVQVTTLEPTVDKKDSHITLHMRVVGPRDKAVELVQNLEHSRRFLLPRIVGETSESAASANQQQLEPVSATNRVSYDVLADYNPATLAEEAVARKKAQGEKKSETAPAAGPTPAAAHTGRPGQRAPYTAPMQSAAPPRPAGPGQAPLPLRPAGPSRRQQPKPGGPQ